MHRVDEGHLNAPNRILMFWLQRILTFSGDIDHRINSETRLIDLRKHNAG